MKTALEVCGSEKRMSQEKSSDGALKLSRVIIMNLVVGIRQHNHFTADFLLEWSRVAT